MGRLITRPRQATTNGNSNSNSNGDGGGDMDLGDRAGSELCAKSQARDNSTNVGGVGRSRRAAGMGAGGRASELASEVVVL
jgi:hypothetical protein